MTLTVENGTGLSTAESYISVAWGRVIGARQLIDPARNALALVQRIYF
jgi:hypothetical protein